MEQDNRSMTVDSLETLEARMAEVREALCREGIMRAVKQKGGKPRKIPASQPMRFCAADGTEILVGRSSVQNDRLTFRAAERRLAARQGYPRLARDRKLRRRTV